MWTPADRALVGDFGAGQAMTDEQFRLLEPLIPPAKSGGRQVRRAAAHDGHPEPAGRLVLSRAHRLPVATPATPSGLPALAHRVWVPARLCPGWRVGEHPPPVRRPA